MQIINIMKIRPIVFFYNEFNYEGGRRIYKSIRVFRAKIYIIIQFATVSGSVERISDIII